MNPKSLQARIRGRVVSRGDGAYEDLRRAMVWNEITPSRRPGLIVTVADDNDVVEAMRFARNNRLRIAVRSGGHSWCGAPLRDAALLLDLSRLNEINVDVDGRRAAVGPAARGRDLCERLEPHGLAFPYGHCSTVGLGGYLLSGGFGWNTGMWGPACFSVSSIDVVTADGRKRVASDTENTELLWAARGAGPGFFGIVTRYHLRLQPLPRAITTSRYVYPLERAPEIAAWVAETGLRLTNQVEVGLFLTGMPADLGPAGDGRPSMVCLLVATAFADSRGDAETLLAPLDDGLQAASCIVAQRLRPTPFAELLALMDGHFPPRHRYLADTFWTNAAPAEVMRRLVPHVAKAPSPQGLALCVFPPPPPAGAPTLPDAAFSMTAAGMVMLYAIWADPKADDDARNWHRLAVESFEPLAVGHYIGESDIAAHPWRAARSFAPENWSRLQALQGKYNPEHLLHGFFDSEE